MMQIPGFYGVPPFTALKRAITGYVDHDMETHASALAFNVLFAIFPFLVFLISMLAFFDLSEFFDWLRQQARPFLPQQAMEQVDTVIEELQIPQAGLLSFGAALALWLASRGIRSIMYALNIAYDAPESRPIWKRFLLSIVYTAAIAFLLAVAAVLLVIGPQAVDWLARVLGLEQVFVVLWTWLRWPVALLMLSLVVALVYYAAPNVEHAFRLISPGSILAILVWVAASFGFAFYVQNFADYSIMYGSIGSIIVLLFYLYISASVLLFGAEFNAAIEKRAGTVSPADEP